jgi:hypothetical protein
MAIMLKELIEFGKTLFELVRTSREHDEQIKQLHADVASLNLRVDELTDAMRELSFEFRQERENRASERELLRLQLENVLLRF